MTIIRDDGVRIDIALALNTIAPGCKFIVDGNTYEGVTWLENEIDLPSEEEVNEVLDRLTQEYHSGQKTKISIEDQLNMLWHDMDQEKIPGKYTSDWYRAVKDTQQPGTGG